MSKIIYISGTGAIAPSGADCMQCFDALLEGDTGLYFDPEFDLPIGHLLQEAEEQVQLLRKQLPHGRQLDRTVMLASLVAKEALIASDIHTTELLGVIGGSSRGATHTFERYHQDFVNSKIARPSMSPMTTAVTMPSTVASLLNCRGPMFYVSSACQTGLTAIGSAMAWITAGLHDQFIATASESCNTAFTVSSLDKLKLLSHSKSQYPLRSGEADRSGMVLSEGAAAVCLESETALLQRQGKAFAKILSFAQSSETSSLAGISKTGEGLQKCLQSIFQKNPPPDLVIAHVPGTINGDQAEMNALDQYIPATVPVTGFKWSTGHMLAASPLFSVTMAIQCMQQSCIPGMPFATQNNIICPDQIDHIETDIRTVLITALGFGGNASALLIQRCD